MRLALASFGLLFLCAMASPDTFAAGKDAASPKAAPAKSGSVAPGDAKKSAADAKLALGAMTPFENKAAGVAMSYPKSWKLEQPGAPHVVRLKHPDATAAMSISLSAQDAFKNESLQDFVAQVNEKTVKLGKESDFKVTILQSKAAGQVAQAPAIDTEMKYDLAAPAPQLKVSQLTFLKGGKAYTLTFTSPSSTHDAYRPVFNEIAKSLKINAAPTALKDPPRRTAIPARVAN